jgi:hypothetical protein
MFIGFQIKSLSQLFDWCVNFIIVVEGISILFYLNKISKIGRVNNKFSRICSSY